MKENKEPRIETISVLNRSAGFGIEVLFCNLARKAFFSVSMVDYKLRKRTQVSAVEKLDYKVEIKEGYCTYSGEDFTATLVKHTHKYHLVLSAPGLVFPSGASGVKAELTLPLFESRTLTYGDDGWKLRLVSPLPVEGMLFLNHKRTPLSPDNSAGFLSSITGDFRKKEISASCCPVTDTAGELWGYVASGSHGLMIRSEETHRARLEEEPLFEITEEISKGAVSFAYSRFSGSFLTDDGAEHVVQPGYGVRASFSV